MKHTIKLLTVAITLAAILTLTGCPGPVTPDKPCTHEHTRTEVIEKATCTEEGLEQTICVDCGELIKENNIEALGHDFGEWDVTEPIHSVTKCEDGKKVHTCSRCNEKEEEVIPVEHDFELTERIIATCTECEKLVAVCKVCENKITNEKPALGHSYGNWNVTKEANCTEKGSKKHTCTRCGEEETVEIDALEHDYQGGYCERCGKYEFENNCYTIMVFTSTEEWQKAHPIDSLITTMQNPKPIYDECKFSFKTNNDIPTNLNELIHLKSRYNGYRVYEFFNGAVWLYTDDIENGGVDIIKNNITEILLSQTNQ